MATTKLNIKIRTDASIQIGTGHVMRCLTLAEALRKNGHNIEFICREEPGNLIDFCREEKKFTVNSLHAGIPFNQQNDLEHASRFLKQTDLVIVDHYEIDSIWEKEALQHYTKYLMVIDDLANRHHDCDIILDQNVYDDFEHSYDGLLPQRCVKLLGPHYVLLREEFLIACKNLQRNIDEVKKILIFMGGSDPENITGKLVEWLKASDLNGISYDVVVGKSNEHSEEIKESCNNHPAFIYHYQIENIASLMAQADLSIGAGGSTTWERCCLGLPSIVITIAENQIEIAQTCSKKGVIKYLGKSKTIDSSMFLETLSALIQNKEIRSEMSSKAMQYVDEKGTQRVVEKLEKECKIN